MEQFSQTPEATSNRLDIIGRIRDAVKKLEELREVDLEKEEGRLIVKVTLDLIFTHIDKIEKDGDYEVVGTIKERLQSIYRILYGIKYDGDNTSKEANTFYTEVNEILEMIERRGARFVEDLDEYQRYHSSQEVA